MSEIKQTCDDLYNFGAELCDFITRMDATDQFYGGTLQEQLKGRAQDITRLKVALFAMLALSAFSFPVLGIGGCFIAGTYAVLAVIAIKEIIIQHRAREKELEAFKKAGFKEGPDTRFTVKDYFDEIKGKIMTDWHSLRYGEPEKHPLL